MFIDRLLKEVKASAKNRTKEQRRQLLIDAHILDKDGVYDKNYFSKETVERSKKNRKVS